MPHTALVAATDITAKAAGLGGGDRPCGPASSCRAVQTGISAALTGTPNQSSCAPAASMPFMEATCSVSLQACMNPRHSALLRGQGSVRTAEDRQEAMGSRVSVIHGVHTTAMLGGLMQPEQPPACKLSSMAVHSTKCREVAVTV